LMAVRKVLGTFVPADVPGSRIEGRLVLGVAALIVEAVDVTCEVT
jgi:hypothetical protein